MEGKQITVKEVLLDAVNTLNNITLPIAFVETIGVKLSTVTKNLHECVVAINQQEEKEKKEGKKNGRKADSE